MAYSKKSLPKPTATGGVKAQPTIGGRASCEIKEEKLNEPLLG